MKFKIGDKVVFTVNGWRGQKGTITDYLDHRTDCPYIVTFENSDRKIRTRDDHIILDTLETEVPGIGKITLRQRVKVAT